MITNYFCRKILSEDNVNYIRKLITAKDVDWKDGNISVLNQILPQKKLFETFNQDVFDIIVSDLDKDMDFNSIVVPDETNNLIISKIIEGGYYKCHLDSELLGNYSTTIFLNEPDEYVGGDLQLLIDGNLKNFKLKAGWGVTYTTGIPHQVLDVTDGVRYAGVFWSTSIISDPFMREIHCGLSNIQQKLESSDKVYSNLKEFADDPIYKIEMLKKNLIRRYR
jgi:PKHD-type hydroxylase